MQPDSHSATEGTQAPGREAESARVIAAARLQRTLQYLAGVIAGMMALCLATCGGSWPIVSGAAIGAVVLAAFAAEVVNLRLQSHLRTGWFSVFVTVVVMVLVGALALSSGGPVAALGAVALICFFDCASSSGRVSRLLRKAGVRVGFLGASNEELRRLQTGVCFHCGYDMAGLPTAMCPECGKESRIGGSA